MAFKRKQGICCHVFRTELHTKIKFKSLSYSSAVMNIVLVPWTSSRGLSVQYGNCLADGKI